MAEQEDTRFKITDRRKFNVDGSPREATEPENAPGDEMQAPTQDQAAGNVVSSADEAKRQPEPSPSAQPRPVASEASAGGPASAGARTAQPAPGHAEQAYNQARGSAPSGLPEASLLSLVNMLAVEAAMHLGLIQTPGEESPPVDLEAARHLIDTLGMLQTKTRGNLTAEEDNLLDSVLADLRMQFVAISRRR